MKLVTDVTNKVAGVTNKIPRNIIIIPYAVGVLVAPFYRWENQGPKMVMNSPKSFS